MTNLAKWRLVISYFFSYMTESWLKIRCLQGLTVLEIKSNQINWCLFYLNIYIIYCKSFWNIVVVRWRNSFLRDLGNPNLKSYCQCIPRTLQLCKLQICKMQTLHNFWFLYSFFKVYLSNSYFFGFGFYIICNLWGLPVFHEIEGS